MAGSMSLPSMITLRAGATRYGLRRTADVMPTEPEKPMSDDTPTQRFSAPRGPEDESTRRLDEVDAGGDETQRLDQVADTPTRRLDQVTDATVPFAAHVPLASLPPDRAAYAPAPPAAGPPVRPRGDTPGAPADRPSRAPLIAVLVIVTLLIAALAIYLLSIASRDDAPAASASASPSATPSTTPTPSPTPSATPSPTPTPAPEPVLATFTSFAPADGSSVLCDGKKATTPIEFTWASDDAEAAWIGENTTNAKENPTAEVDTSGTYSDFEFSCEIESQVYTVTLESADGELTSRSVTLVRQLAQ